MRRWLCCKMSPGWHGSWPGQWWLGATRSHSEPPERINSWLWDGGGVDWTGLEVLPHPHLDSFSSLSQLTTELRPPGSPHSTVCTVVRGERWEVRLSLTNRSNPALQILILQYIDLQRKGKSFCKNRLINCSKLEIFFSKLNEVTASKVILN